MMMKISELIEELQAIRVNYGDYDIFVHDDMSIAFDGMNQDFEIEIAAGLRRIEIRPI